MSDVEDLYPPAQYGALWLLIVFGVLVLGLLAVILVLWFTRPRYSLTRTVTAPVQQGPPIDHALAALRQEYLGRLQRIEDGYRSGEIGARTANQRLSREVREFVLDYSGFEAPVLGLNDMVALGVHPSLIDALQRHYYPSIFRSQGVIDPIAGVQAGRTVVMSWH